MSDDYNWLSIILVFYITSLNFDLLPLKSLVGVICSKWCHCTVNHCTLPPKLILCVSHDSYQRITIVVINNDSDRFRNGCAFLFSGCRDWIFKKTFYTLRAFQWECSNGNITSKKSDENDWYKE